MNDDQWTSRELYYLGALKYLKTILQKSFNMDEGGLLKSLKEVALPTLDSRSQTGNLKLQHNNVGESYCSRTLRYESNKEGEVLEKMGPQPKEDRRNRRNSINLKLRISGLRKKLAFGIWNRPARRDNLF